MVARVALSEYTNFFNRLAHTEIDFPAVRHQQWSRTHAVVGFSHSRAVPT